MFNYQHCRGLFCSAAVFFSPPSQVMINNGFTPDKEDYEFCTKVDNMIIPSDGFFGISAATGGLAGTDLSSVLKALKVKCKWPKGKPLISL